MLILRCTFLRGVFEGSAADDPRSPEWPPSWMRLFSALVSVAEPDTDDDLLLRRLEAADPPHIRSGLATYSRRRSFVPTNARPKLSGHTSLPGRTNGERHWPRVLPQDPTVLYRWSDLEFSTVEEARLAALVRRVPYLGRSTSPTVVEIIDADAPVEGWIVPGLLDDPTFELTGTVRSPFVGALAALRAAHEEKFVRGGAGNPWQIGTGVTYGTTGTDTQEVVERGPFRHMVVFRLRHPERDRRRASMDGRHTARIAYAVRRALMSRIGEDGRDIPAALHGHHGGDVRQVAILGLVNVGNEYAKGQLLGVALAVPELDRHDLGRLMSALPEPNRSMSVNAGPFGELHLERLAAFDAADRRGLRTDRWQGPARRWTTATPAVLDRFLKRKMVVEDEVRRSVRHAGLPDPIAIEVARSPFVAGGLSLTARDTLRRPDDRGVRPYRHLRIEFDRPLHGPIVIGSMRNYGLGLCVPIAPERGAEHGT